MKKKKQSSSKPTSILDLKTLIQNHSVFFDNLVELIPARFYLPVEDNEKPWFQGLSKTAKYSAKKESKLNRKKGKREKLDPEKNSTTLELLKEKIDTENKKEEDEESEDDDDDDVVVEFESNENEEGENNRVGPKASEGSVTYEELRERLHRKIEQLRGKRVASEIETPRNEKRREIREGKRKRYDEGNVKESHEKEKKIEENVVKASEGLAFSHVKIGSDEEGRKKKRKVSKVKELEEAKKLDDMKKDPEEGKKFLWKAATSRAAGIKVHDNPKLIKESIKKDKKRHEKNVGKWKERVESRDKVRIEKQQKRSGNIAERKNDKKMRRIAKREKKLMRPGFEGRKEGFITK
ncbi:hypothetical protein IFM89_015329 [Coptis chinensis]|uniref:Ribosomal RNA-processing protein 14/surfeit locus protein 6 C-terminal domain-containing protein n=1 Tax=Coptis chinensis TaxID=261450 RepID=A0A835M924_9MAGN|nr:hypothetical protein IFM89_015329 [Coptis chinensis]